VTSLSFAGSVLLQELADAPLDPNRTRAEGPLSERRAVVTTPAALAALSRITDKVRRSQLLPGNGATDLDSKEP
jgi:hypothetical protein